MSEQLDCCFKKVYLTIYFISYETRFFLQILVQYIIKINRTYLKLSLKENCSWTCSYHVYHNIKKSSYFFIVLYVYNNKTCVKKGVDMKPFPTANNISGQTHPIPAVAHVNKKLCLCTNPRMEPTLLHYYWNVLNGNLFPILWYWRMQIKIDVESNLCNFRSHYG